MRSGRWKQLMALAVVFAGVLASCGAQPEPPSAPPPTAAAAPAAPAPALPAAPLQEGTTPEPTEDATPAALPSAVVFSSIEDLTISVGTTVQWSNQDQTPHTSTSGDPGNASGV